MFLKCYLPVSHSYFEKCCTLQSWKLGIKVPVIKETASLQNKELKIIIKILPYDL